MSEMAIDQIARDQNRDTVAEVRVNALEIKEARKAIEKLDTNLSDVARIVATIPTMIATAQAKNQSQFLALALSALGVAGAIIAYLYTHQSLIH
jgi:hypothetical protein